MINYPIGNSNDKFTYAIGINQCENESESTIFMQFTHVQLQTQIRVAMDREQFRQFVEKINMCHVHYF